MVLKHRIQINSRRLLDACCAVLLVTLAPLLTPDSRKMGRDGSLKIRAKSRSHLVSVEALGKIKEAKIAGVSCSWAVFGLY